MHTDRRTHKDVQGLSERRAFLKLQVLGTESTIGAQIIGKISLKGIHLYILVIKNHSQDLENLSIFKEL